MEECKPLMDGSTRVTILAALEFSYPQQRITAAASVDALVSGKQFSFAGGSLRTSTRPTLYLPLLLRPSG